MPRSQRRELLTAPLPSRGVPRAPAPRSFRSEGVPSWAHECTQKLLELPGPRIHFGEKRCWTILSHTPFLFEKGPEDR